MRLPGRAGMFACGIQEGPTDRSKQARMPALPGSMRLRARNLVVIENSGEGAMKKIFAVSALLISISVATSSVAISGATPFIKFDWERAVSLYKQGQFREAIAEFRKVLDEAPDHPDSWKFIGLSYYQLKEYKSAIQPLEKALELKRKDNRNDPDLYRALELQGFFQRLDRRLV